MDITTPFLVLIPVVVGVAQVVKISGLPTQWIPLTSLVLGVIGAFLIGGWVFSGTVVIQGIIAGLSAAGLWSGVKTTSTSTATTQ